MASGDDGAKYTCCAVRKYVVHRLRDANVFTFQSSPYADTAAVSHVVVSSSDSRQAVRIRVLQHRGGGRC